MTFEDALEFVKAVLNPHSLSKVEIGVLRETWNDKAYYLMVEPLQHEYGYIKDVGSTLWQLLSQELWIKVTKLNLREVLTQHSQLQQIQSDRPALPQCRVDWGEAPDVSHTNLS